MHERGRSDEKQARSNKFWICHPIPFGARRQQIRTCLLFATNEMSLSFVTSQCTFELGPKGLTFYFINKFNNCFTLNTYVKVHKMSESEPFSSGSSDIYQLPDYDSSSSDDGSDLQSILLRSDLNIAFLNTVKTTLKLLLLVLQRERLYLIIFP